MRRRHCQRKLKEALDRFEELTIFRNIAKEPVSFWFLAHLPFPILHHVSLGRAMLSGSGI